MFAQFLLNDIGPPDDAKTPIEASKGWQSGLYFHDGRPKPAVQAFKVPFWAESQSVPGGDFVVVFGQVRPGSGRKQIEVEMKGTGGTWIPVETYATRAGELDCGSQRTSFLTDAEGFYQRIAPYEGRATYRARWIKPDGTSEYSITIPVRPPGHPPTSA